MFCCALLNLQECAQGALSDVFMCVGQHSSRLNRGKQGQHQVGVERMRRLKCLIINTPSVPWLFLRVTGIEPVLWLEIEHHLQLHWLPLFRSCVENVISLETARRVYLCCAIQTQGISKCYGSTLTANREHCHHSSHFMRFNLFIRTPDREKPPSGSPFVRGRDFWSLVLMLSGLSLLVYLWGQRGGW